jgi:hypothetical protein
MTITEKSRNANIIQDAPFLENVIEQKNVEVHKKPVVQEVHEKKVIAMENRPVVQHQDLPEEQVNIKQPTRFESLGAEESEMERKRLLELQQVVDEPKVFQKQNLKSFQHDEKVEKVIQKEIIEHHIQPHITQVNEKKIIENIEQPIVRIIHEAPVVHYINNDLKLTADTGLFDALAIQANGPKISQLSCAGKKHIWSVCEEGHLHRLVRVENQTLWSWMKLELAQHFVDLSVVKGGLLFAIGTDGILYKISYSDSKCECVPEDTQYKNLKRVAAASERTLYVITADDIILTCTVPLVFGSAHDWKEIGRNMKKLSVGATHFIRHTEVWGIGMDNKPYRFKDDKWLPMSNLTIQDLSVTVDNAVYCVGTDGFLYKWNGHEEMVRMTGSPQAMPMDKNAVVADIFLTNVTAYKEKKVYSVERGTSKVWYMVL